MTELNGGRLVMPDPKCNTQEKPKRSTYYNEVSAKLEEFKRRTAGYDLSKIKFVVAKE